MFIYVHVQKRFFAECATAVIISSSTSINQPCWIYTMCIHTNCIIHHHASPGISTMFHHGTFYTLLLKMPPFRASFPSHSVLSHRNKIHKGCLRGRAPDHNNCSVVPNITRLVRTSHKISKLELLMALDHSHVLRASEFLGLIKLVRFRNRMTACPF